MIIRVLCVDDSKLSRRFIKKGILELLEGKEVFFEEAADAEEGLALCRRYQYSFVVLDLTMPGMSGYDMLKVLKDEQIFQKIIVLTADIQPLAEDSVMALGAFGYLKKPFELEKMSNMLKKIGVL